MIIEGQLEQLTLDWFKSTGYDIAADGVILERTDYRQIAQFKQLYGSM